MSLIDPREQAAAHAATHNVDFYAEALKASAAFRHDYDGRMNIVKAHEMPFERSPNGLIKHVINELERKPRKVAVVGQGLLAGVVQIPQDRTQTRAPRKETSRLPRRELQGVLFG